MNAKEVGVKLVALCNAGKNMEAIETLYADGVESVEVCGDESMPKVMKGIDAVRKKGEWWYENHDAHGGEAMGPYPNEDRFAVHFKFEVTPKVGPMTK